MTRHPAIKPDREKQRNRLTRDSSDLSRDFIDVRQQQIINKKVQRAIRHSNNQQISARDASSVGPLPRPIVFSQMRGCEGRGCGVAQHSVSKCTHYADMLTTQAATQVIHLVSKVLAPPDTYNISQNAACIATNRQIYAHITFICTENRTDQPQTTSKPLDMDAALRFYSFEHLDIFRTLPPDHWFMRGYHQLSRTPTREDLFMRHPPFGLVRDEDYEEEMELQSFLAKRMLRREAEAARNVVTAPRKHLLSLSLVHSTRSSARPDRSVAAFVISGDDPRAVMDVMEHGHGGDASQGRDHQHNAGKHRPSRFLNDLAKKNLC